MKGFSTGFSAARRALFLLSVSVPAVMIGHEVVAQQITSGVRGVVTDPSGAPVADARVVITDTRTGRQATVTTNAQGRYAASGLEVGGPYTVLVESGRLANQRVDGLILSISDVSVINVALTESQQLEEIVVTAAASIKSRLAIGPNSSYGLDTLENLPSIQRDIRDTIRIDPRVNIEQGNSSAVSCLGGNNRFNAFTIDGVRNADAFGLNASGFPSRNTLPVPFDSVRETSVEFSPFGVEFGQFTGCNINVVTKSGSNEFHGSSFFVFNSQALTGNKLEGDEAINTRFRDWNWGVDLSGPIIKDKLFLYFAYEETNDTNNEDRGPIGAGFANEQILDVGEANRIQSILESSFGQDTGGFARSLPSDSRRFLARLDWFITDAHRAAFSYTRLREAEGSADDFGFDGFAFQNNFNIQGNEIETYSLRVFSDWTENLSTEFRVSRIDNLDLQDPVGGGEAQSGNPIPRFIVQEPGRGDIAVSGPGFSRTANLLDTQTDQIKAKAVYRTGRHTITGGYELDQLDVFNLFAQDATGTFTFGSIDDFEAGLASGISLRRSFTGDINDAAADFSRSIHSLYVQDEWQATDELLLTFGLRYDFFTSSDNPPLNSRFVERFGFDNTQAFDDLDILLPRFAFNYDAPWEFFGKTTLRGGAGVFTGGDPTVWFSNAFSNFGSGLGFATTSGNCPAETLQVLDGAGNFTGLPQCLLDAAQGQALANRGPVDAVDPDFALPSVVRGSFGFTHFTDFQGAAGGFFDDWEVNMDVIHTRRRNAPDVIDLTLTPVGFAPDGRPIFNRIDPLRDGCNAVFLGPRRGFSGDTERGGPCSATNSNQDTLLTNVDGNDNGGSVTFSAIFAKQFEYEAFSRPGTFDLTFGYAFTKAKEVNPTTSSTAGSNIEEVALEIINNPPLANSQFSNRHNVTMSAIFRNDWWQDNTTTFGFFFQAREGNPFSFAFDDRTSERLFGASDDESQLLLYVPRGRNDPLADFSQISQSDLDNFFAFLEKSGLNKFAGQIAPRNEFRDPWFKQLDMRFAQEFPGPFRGDRFEFTVDIDNVLNLISSSANIEKQFDRGDVGETVPLAGATLSPDGNRFVFTSVATGLPNTDVRTGGGGDLERIVDASIWRIQIGLRYSF